MTENKENTKKNQPKSKNKKKKNKIGKVNPLLYAAVYAVLKPLYVKKYGIEFDNSIVKDIKGPAIILGTHTSDVDHIISALTLYPIRPTYVVSEHFIRQRSTAGLLRLMKVITKKMFTPDASTIVNIMRAKREGAVIVIFPEGRLSCYGHSLPITDGTAELIKKFGTNVYIWKGEGAYLSFPKWREKGGERRGKIRSFVKLLLDADEIAQMSIDEIRKIAADAILHDDELAMQGIEYKCGDMSLGVDKILFKCPACLSEGTIGAKDGKIFCSCGFSASLDSFYRLTDAPFTRVNEWFEWQQNSIDTENEKLSSKVRLGCCGEDGFMDPYAGECMAYLDKEVFILSGIMHGEKIEFSIPSDKIGAFPITAGEHFDVYHHGRLIYVYPLPDTRMSVKWVCFLDKLNKEKEDKTQK